MSILRTSCASLGLFALTASALASGCDISRPAGFYKPMPTVVEQGNAGAFDAGGVEMGGTTGQPPPDGLPPEQHDGGTPVVSDPALLQAQGYYYLRTDFSFTYTAMQTGATFEVKNRVSHMALTRLIADGDVLTGVERTCHIFYIHNCIQSCDNLTTVIAPNAVPLYRDLDLPREYTLTNGGKEFVTNQASLVLGWTGPASPMPTSLSDASLWGTGTSKGLYVNVKTTGLPTNPFSPNSPTDLDCYYNTVERFTSSFKGTLKNGSLDGVTGTMATDGSDAQTLNEAGGALCAKSNTGATSGEIKSVRFAKVANADPTAFWNCPALADFKAKLPD